MFVSAVDRDGEPVSNLGPDAFQIKEDGIKREVLRVSRATEPLDIAILVDNSAAASDDITFFRTGLSKFVAKMAPGNHIAVIALADRPTILVDYTDDTKRLSDAVGRLFSMSQSGMTLLDGIRQMAMTATDPHSMGRNFPSHFAKREWNVCPMTSVVGVQWVKAPGTAHVQKRHGGDGITIVVGGDAGTAEGDFASCLIWSTRPGKELPVLMVVTNSYGDIYSGHC